MSYNLLQPVKIISQGDMSASITSPAVEIKSQDNVGVQLHWTGTPTGAFDIQISSNHRQDAEGNIQVPGNWISLVLNPTITASGFPDDAYIDLNQMSALYMRTVYAPASGTGNLDAYVVAKGV